MHAQTKQSGKELNLTEKLIARQVTDTARAALKEIVGRNMLPWPDIYSAEFWLLAQKHGYEGILLKRHEIKCGSKQLAQEFLEKADEILGGVNETVSSLVNGTISQTEEMASTIEALKNIPIDDPEVSEGIDRLHDTNIKLQIHSSNMETRLEEQSRLINELQKQLRKDSLTGLLNREALNKDLKKELAKTRRYHYPLTVLMIDIDHFKEVNDVYGHLAGDSVLKVIARLLEKTIREADSAYRYGGEEFLALLPHTTADEAMILANRIKDIVAKHTFIDKTHDISISVTISGGISEFRNGDDESSLIARADKALYLAKQNGRNQIVKL